MICPPGIVSVETPEQGLPDGPSFPPSGFPFIKSRGAVPLRVDCAGGWGDVPRFSRPDGFIVNCAISPLVSLTHWPYEKNAGLGGSAAWALLNGKNPISSELDMGVGWQDPAIILETGLCVWRSGHRPALCIKREPTMLQGRMALLWTGKPHVTASIVSLPRDYNRIHLAGLQAAQAVSDNDYRALVRAVRESYGVQLAEGMMDLPFKGELACKYVGAGHGGYALYLYDSRPTLPDLIPIEPYMANPYA